MDEQQERALSDLCAKYVDMTKDAKMGYYVNAIMEETNEKLPPHMHLTLKDVYLLYLVSPVQTTVPLNQTTVQEQPPTQPTS